MTETSCLLLSTQGALTGRPAHAVHTVKGAREVQTFRSSPPAVFMNAQCQQRTGNVNFFLSGKFTHLKSATPTARALQECWRAPPPAFPNLFQPPRLTNARGALPVTSLGPSVGTWWAGSGCVCCEAPLPTQKTSVRLSS